MLRTLLFTAIVLFSFVACEKNEEPCKCNTGELCKCEPEESCKCEPEEPGGPVIITTDGTYTGLLSVDQTDGTSYKQENVKVSIITDTLLMYQVKFSDRMPIKLDMTIPGITTEEADSGLILSGDNIIPMAMGGEFPQYTITGLTGEITADKISLSMKCGNYPLTFSGDIEK